MRLETLCAGESPAVHRRLPQTAPRSLSDELPTVPSVGPMSHPAHALGSGLPARRDEQEDGDPVNAARLDECSGYAGRQLELFRRPGGERGVRHHQVDASGALELQSLDRGVRALSGTTMSVKT